MTKVYRIFALFLVLIFLTTYSSNKKDVSEISEDFIFKIKEIDIINNSLIEKDKIIKKLSNLYGKNIFFLNKSYINEQLNLVDFLEKFDVKKKYPNKVIIKIYETEPLGIVIKDNKKYLLDSSSKLISSAKYTFSDKFPGIFGENAEKYFVEFFNQLKDNNFSIDQVKNYYYFQIGRWDLQLLNNQTIKFPSDKIEEAIQQSNKLLDRKDFKEYNIIDLRISDKIVVE